MDLPRVAALFGGPSAEHDVSILTGLQALEAIDPTKYTAFPVYIDLQGHWWVGPEPKNPLRERKNYLPDLALQRQLTRVQFAVGGARGQGRWMLQAVNSPLLGRAATFPVDMFLPALHGTWGEDGTLQGVLAAEGALVAGSGVAGMATTIHKHHTALIAASLGIPTVPSVLVRRGELPDPTVLKKLGTFPLFVKPNFLGSSIGVHKVQDGAALNEALASVLRLDTAALIQPCITPLVEYNVAVRRLPSGEVVTSAIERPAMKGDSYDFKTKYLSGNANGKMGEKLGGEKLAALRGIIGATRAIHPPELVSGKGAKLAEQIRAHATALFTELDLAGTPRLDFMLNERSGELYFNEINPTPGSFAFFLWEAAEGDAQTGLTGLMTALLEEAKQRVRSQYKSVDPASMGGVIFSKRG
jgi:D-alanine-D-alanine ligase